MDAEAYHLWTLIGVIICIVLLMVIAFGSYRRR
jgi:hypothetical protein